MECEQRVVGIADNHSYEDGFNGKFGEYRIRKIREAISLLPEMNSVLEIGCGEGRITAFLDGCFERVVAVEPSEKFLEKAKKRATAEFHQSLFENWDSHEKFDCIVITGVLEHVRDVGVFLRLVKEKMKKETLVILTVPNAYSLHRRLGLKMGLIGSLTELGELDNKVGHYRYYDSVGLIRDLNGNGFAVLSMGGIFLKPLPFAEIERLPEEYLEALFLVGEEYPESCAELFVIAKRML